MSDLELVIRDGKTFLEVKENKKLHEFLKSTILGSKKIEANRVVEQSRAFIIAGSIDDSGNITIEFLKPEGASDFIKYVTDNAKQ